MYRGTCGNPTGGNNQSRLFFKNMCMMITQNIHTFDEENK